MPTLPLHAGFVSAAARRPDHVAVVDPGHGELDYAALEQLSARLRDRLRAMGVGPGERVGLHLHKSADSVAAILAVLRSGAAYVPVDPKAPASRNGYIFANCRVAVVVGEASVREAVLGTMAEHGHRASWLSLGELGGGVALQQALAAVAGEEGEAPATADHASAPDDLAYILYTSGSTGRPKGVMLSHRNAGRFVDWCHENFQPRDDDRFSSHAPFHFDLSILDLYTPLTHGATLVLVGEDTGKDPQGLAALIEEQRLTVWYSTPSILALLAQYGELGSRDLSALRLLLFAGEVFPMPHLRKLREQLPAPRYCNLYGPTETNVCTWFELPPADDPGRDEPYPIGAPCAHYDALVVDPSGEPVTAGDEGELLIAGDGVMQGYWELPERTAQAFLDRGDGRRWYRTGDLVDDIGSGCLRYVGRRDRMVKKRGYRVELGEIEVSLYRRQDIVEAAVVAAPDAAGDLKVHAHLVVEGGGRTSIIKLKSFCASQLPVYMVPDFFHFHETLPKTSTDKTDYQALLREHQG